MCGIVGIFNYSGLTEKNIFECNAAVRHLSHRGPDYQVTFQIDKVCLGHSRLSIIDISNAANQPFEDETKRYTLIYNGEIYNYKELRNELSNNFSINFKTESDTEVLLYWLINKGVNGLNRLNGFFAFALYDKEEQSLLLARDRFGIKPLLYLSNESEFLFASELSALAKFSFKKKLDPCSIYNYLQFSYIPSPYSIYENVRKLEPGSYIIIKNNAAVEKNPFYELKYTTSRFSKETTYQKAQRRIVELLHSSIEKRLIADVPVGTFLSGGVDSSIVTAVASTFKKNISSFSIGYADEPYFDETEYALTVSKKLGTDHHVFKLTNKEIINSIYSILEDNNEPFADSSSIAVNILAQKTRENVTVALSGDGADELFSGYHKHMAEYFIRQNSQLIKLLAPLKYLLPILPQSRNSKFGNIIRQSKKLLESSKYTAKNRYWRMASILGEEDAGLLLKYRITNEYPDRKEKLLYHLRNNDFNDVLYTDFKIVLQSDMLYKVDSMSMKNSLEVRVPFLDHELVDYVFQLPSEYKIKGKVKKRILQDAFRDFLPKEVFHRPKKGFEVPLLKLFRGDLRHLVDGKLLSDDFIKEQNIFDTMAVKKLKKQLKSNQPSNAEQVIWSLILFNTWWIKNF